MERRIVEPLPALLLALAAIGLAACAGGPAALEDAGGTLVRRAWLHDSPHPAPPPPDDPGWREVALPDWWDLRRRQRQREGWYRLDFAGPRTADDEPWAVAIEGDWSALRIELNGVAQAEELARRSSGIEREPSVMVSLPVEALAPGTNRLLLRFETAPWRIGHLGPIAVGPAEAVRAHHDRLRLLRATLPVSFAWFTLACTAIVALLGRWEPRRASRWFAAGLLAWCLPMVEPTGALVGLGHGFAGAVATHAFPPLFVIGFHRALEWRRPRLERALLGSILAGAGLRLLVPPLLIPAVDWVWWYLDAAIGLYLVALGIRAARVGAIPRAGLLLAGIVLAVAAGLHDAASLLARRPLVGVSLWPYAPAMVAFGTAAALAAALGTRLGEARRLNLELEQRVEEKRLELADSYARMAQLERERAIAGERERLMRDMHDGTGGQLVSALAMVETGRFEADAVAELLRDALADLRFSIDSLDPSEPDLLALLGAARARLEPRLEARGVAFSWQVRDVDPPAGFGPETALQVLRIFQEAVVNAVRHGDPRTITVRTGEQREASGARRVVVEVADDGRGFVPADAAAAGRAGGGRGLGNMRRRAAAIGGSLTVTSGASGTTVRLELPLAPDPPPAATRPS